LNAASPIRHISRAALSAVLVLPRAIIAAMDLPKIFCNQRGDGSNSAVLSKFDTEQSTRRLAPPILPDIVLGRDRRASSPMAMRRWGPVVVAATLSPQTKENAAVRFGAVQSRRSETLELLMLRLRYLSRYELRAFTAPSE
jgi:hypothetical protein